MIVLYHIEKLPEGYYLATSLQGLVAQGRTITAFSKTRTPKPIQEDISIYRKLVDTLKAGFT